VPESVAGLSGAGQNEGMALIPCYECEKEISDKAPACPHCGAPKKKAAPKKEAAPAKKAAPSTEPEPLATKDARFTTGE